MTPQVREVSISDNENEYEVTDRTELGARPKIRGNTIDIRSKVSQWYEEAEKEVSFQSHTQSQFRKSDQPKIKS